MEYRSAACYLVKTKEFLRQFLRRRGVPSDPKETQKALAEKCFWAEKLGLEVKYSDDEAAEDITSAKAKKLILDGGLVKLPRPETLSGWELSSQSIPDVSRAQVETYISSVCRKLGCTGSGGKTLGLGKGLFLSGHVSEVQFRGINPNINYCFIRAKVAPQTRSTKAPYHPWIVLTTNGSIKTAECSCIVGVQSGCKHVAAVLFTLVDAVERGLNRATTSRRVSWGQPSKTNRSGAVLAENVQVLKIQNNAANQTLSTASKSYRSGFDPRAVINREQKHINSSNWDTLAEITNGNCGILMYVDRAKDATRQQPIIEDVINHEEVNTTVLPLTVEEAVFESDCNSPHFAEQIKYNLHIDQNQKSQIIHNTMTQSNSHEWHNHRVGRVTASVAKVCIDTVVGSPPTRLDNAHTALARVMDYYGRVTSPSLDWGRGMEQISINHYIANHKLVKGHLNIFCEHTGLWLSMAHPYIGASPDGIISCKQCGRGLVEVKNPYKYRNMSISELCMQGSYLHLTNGVIQLDRDHEYYVQIQFQLWVTGFSWCDFVVRTRSNKDNLHVERIYKDNSLINSILPKVIFFFFQGVVPEILYRRVHSRVIENAVRKTLNVMLTVLDTSVQTAFLPFPCGSCGLECSQSPGSVAFQSIACDACDQWSHFSCIGLTGAETFLRKRKASWKCNSCKSIKRKRQCLR